MEWKNPDGSITGGVVIEDGSGNKVTSFGGGGSGGGSNASVGASGSAAPSNATEIGFVNAVGNLAAVSPSNPLPVAIAADNVTLSVSAATNLVTSDSGVAISGANMPSGGSGVTGWLSAIWSKLTGTLNVAGSVSISNFPANQAVSATALPLPAGAATAANQASLVNTGAGAAARVVLVDPLTGNGSLVTAFHNTDNQAIGSSSYGVMTGGVDQLLNGSGNLDRKRGVAGDGMSITGLAAEVPMVFNGASFDRLYGDKTNGAWVNVKALPSLPTGANQIGSVTVSNFPATQAVSWSGQSVSISGTLPAFAAAPTFNLGSSIPAGSNVIGAVNLDIGGATVSQGNPVPTTETYSNIATGQISAATSATQIVAARAGRKEVTIVNHATTAVYIGGSSVTATTGLLLAGVQGQGITITGGAAIYAIAASGSETVSFLEVY